MITKLLRVPFQMARTVTTSAGRRPRQRDLKVVIVGAGFSGIAMALAMKGDGRAHEMLIVEAADDIGGTWRDNTYPGCACDVPSPVYSLRGEPNAWTHFYAPQEEILEYLVRVVDSHDLRQHMRLGTRIVSQTWDEATATWLLRTQDDDVILADVVINGLGPLTQPVIPDIPGIATFDGPAFHTARWRHDVDLTGLRVGVVGTGASAVQVIPEVVDQVAALHVFQRTPAWVLPKMDKELSAPERMALRVPQGHDVVRRVTHEFLERVVWRMILQDEATLDRLHKAGRWNISRSVSDPDLRAALTPEVTVGCKRLLMSNTYYPALAQDHVQLHTTAIRQLTPGGIELADGADVDLDVIIWGTGFDPRRFWGQLEVVGRDGVTLDDAWASAPQTLNGITSTGFPNSFFLLGPNTGTGHNSVVMMAEAQADHILQALRPLRDGRADWIAPTAAATARFADEMAAKHADLVWASGCGSWYLDEDGNNFSLYPGNIGDYQRRVRHFSLRDYELGRRTARTGTRRKVTSVLS